MFAVTEHKILIHSLRPSVLTSVTEALVSVSITVSYCEKDDFNSKCNEFLCRENNLNVLTIDISYNYLIHFEALDFKSKYLKYNLLCLLIN